MSNLDVSLFKHYLKRPAIYFMLAAVLLGSANTFLAMQKQQMILDQNAQKSQLRKVIHQVEFLRIQEQLFLKYGDKYQQLMQYGLVHQQNRVKWVDALLEIQQFLVMHPFTIQFEPEQLLARDRFQQFVIDKDIFYYTRLNLRAGLHSDLDFQRLIQWLSEEVTPLFMVESCELSKLPAGRSETLFIAEKPKLFLECAILLLEAKPKPFKGIDDELSEL
ncbi:hypothetical protein CYQ88_01080 [Hydrogenovibrio sp. SC-1]|uniref:hypothetical protein n=1 Tax=Hydrogenovibrio sp. SC-1 TaxID=2065820 RepID=UPI000C7C8438|nr:hypothetical protein [Hydrogenovibrio sp. SC-1]PLA75587.1 hypothetical protein CYQ88_01080 [Hydrogenovibrio sp. SC-1]